MKLALVVCIAFCTAMVCPAIKLPNPGDNWHIKLNGAPITSTITLRQVWHSKYQAHDYMYTPTGLFSKVIYDDYTDIRRNNASTYRIGNTPSSSCAARALVFPLSIFSTPDVDWTVGSAGTCDSVACDTYTASNIPTGVGSYTADYTAYFYKGTARPCKLHVVSTTTFDMNVVEWNTDVQSTSSLTASGCTGVWPSLPDCPSFTSSGAVACTDALCKWCTAWNNCTAIDGTCASEIPTPIAQSSSITNSNNNNQQPEPTSSSNDNYNHPEPNPSSTNGNNDVYSSEKGSVNPEPDEISLPNLPCSVHFKASTSIYSGAATAETEMWIGHSSISRITNNITVISDDIRAFITESATDKLARTDLGLLFETTTLPGSVPVCVNTAITSSDDIKLMFGPIDLEGFNWTEYDASSTWHGIAAESYSGYQKTNIDNLLMIFYKRGTQQILGLSGTFFYGSLAVDVVATVSEWEQQTELASAGFAVKSICGTGYANYPATPTAFVLSCLTSNGNKNSDSDSDDKVNNPNSANLNIISSFAFLLTLIVSTL